MSSHTKSLSLPRQRKKMMTTLYRTNKETGSMKNLLNQMFSIARGLRHICVSEGGQNNIA